MLGHFRDAAAQRAFELAYADAMRLLPAPTRSDDVPTRYGRVRIYRFGSAATTPIVLLPGHYASTPMWHGVLEHLMTTHSVYALDALGEPGMSEQTRALTSAQDQARWLDEALAATGALGVHVVGASIGGHLGLNLALHARERVATLCLLEPASVFARYSWKTVVVSLGAAFPLMPDALRMRILSWISGAETDESEPIAKLIAAGMRGWVNAVPTPKYPRDDELRRLDMPVLALLAGRSIVHNAARAAARARRVLGRGQVELWPEASHAVTGEFPERVAQTILSFVGRYR